MLTTCTSSTGTDLTTTSYVRGLLGTTSTGDEAVLSPLVGAASRWAEGYLGYPVTLRAYQETVPGYGTRNLMLSRTPVLSVPRLFDSSDTGTANEFLSSEYRVEDRDAGLLSRDDGWEWGVPADFDLSARPRPGQEFRPWLVDYHAGWTYGGLTTDSPHWSTVMGTTSTARSLPDDVEYAVAQKVIDIYTGAENVVGEELGDLKVQYRSGSLRAERPSVPEMVLASYRRIV